MMFTRFAVLARSAIFNFLFFGSLIVLMIAGLPLLPFGPRGARFVARIWCEWSLILLRALCDLRVEFRGTQHIPASGYLLAAKHQSFLETFALLRYTPEFVIIHKRSLSFIPLFGLYLSASRQIAIDRTRGPASLAKILKRAGEALREGRQLVIFPEGTRRPPGAPPAYKVGAAALYAANEAPCLPVALNTGLFWSRRGFVRRPGVAVIEFLPPIPPGLERSAFARRLQSTIEAGCARLAAEAVAADPSLAAILAAGAAPKEGARVKP